MAVSGASGGDDEMQTRVQQSPLASQRAKQDGNTAGNSRAAKAVGYFTLGYKEGFNQWVGRYEAEGR
jgi:cardiolipin-specific phospholipase